jgi:hypothetical protein
MTFYICTVSLVLYKVHQSMGLDSTSDHDDVFHYCQPLPIRSSSFAPITPEVRASSDSFPRVYIAEIQALGQIQYCKNINTIYE